MVGSLYTARAGLTSPVPVAALDCVEIRPADTAMTKLYRKLLPFALLLLSACTTPVADFDTPDIELLGLRPLPAEGLEARFLVRLRVVNPNTVPLEIEGIHYQVYLRERQVLSGVSAEVPVIPPYAEGIVELEAAAGVLGSLALLRDLMADPPDGGLPYRLQTKLSLAGTLRALRLEKDGVLDLGARSP
jgi:LEA14-like dessication related protein